MSVDMSSLLPFFAVPVAALAAQPLAQANVSSVAVLYPNGTAELGDAFRQVFGHFARSFDYDLYGRFEEDFGAGLETYKQSTVFAQ